MLTEAWLTLSWIDFAISFLPYHWWKSWLSIQSDIKTNQQPATSLSFEQLVWSVNAAANHHLRKPTCLRRSLTLKCMLQRRGIPADLRIGIRKNGTQIAAHAWIEHTGTVINDSPDIATSYSQFPVLTKELMQGFQNL